MSNSSCNSGGIYSVMTILGAGILIVTIVIILGGGFNKLVNIITDLLGGPIEYKLVKVNTTLYDEAKEKLGYEVFWAYDDVASPHGEFSSIEDALNQLNEMEPPDYLEIRVVEDTCSFTIIYSFYVYVDVYHLKNEELKQYQYRETYDKDCYSEVYNDVSYILEYGEAIIETRPNIGIAKPIAIIIPVLLLIGGIILGLVLWIGGAYRLTNK